MKKQLLAGMILSALFSTTALAALSPQQEQQLEEINTFLKENPETISGLHTSLQQYLAGKEQAEKAQAELARLNAEGEEIINKARAEAQTILSEGKAASAKLKDEILNDAKEKEKSIVADATKQIQVEKEKAIAEIKSEVVNLSLSVAEKLIKKNLSAEDNKALIDESLSHVKKYEA